VSARYPPLCCHARQQLHPLVDIADDENLDLSIMLPIQTANILSQRAFPR
jgi:hypothetical protein